MSSVLSGPRGLHAAVNDPIVPETCGVVESEGWSIDNRLPFRYRDWANNEDITREYPEIVYETDGSYNLDAWGEPDFTLSTTIPNNATEDKVTAGRAGDVSEVWRSAIRFDGDPGSTRRLNMNLGTPIVQTGYFFTEADGSTVLAGAPQQAIAASGGGTAGTPDDKLEFVKPYNQDITFTFPDSGEVVFYIITFDSSNAHAGPIVSFRCQPILVDDKEVGDEAGTPHTYSAAATDNDNPDNIHEGVFGRIDMTPSSLKFINDADEQVDSLTVTGEGEWTVDGDGVVTFTPESTFFDDPTPVDYLARDAENILARETATIFLEYPPIVEDQTASGKTGEPTTINPLENIKGDDIEGSTVKLIDEDGNPVDTLETDNGTWTVNPDGTITFEPNDDYQGEPDSVPFAVIDSDGNQSNTGTATVDYPPKAEDQSKIGGALDEETSFSPLDDVAAGDVTGNEVKLVDPVTGDYVDTVVTENGTWSVDDNGEVTFKPNSDYNGEPDEIDFVVVDDGGNASEPKTLTVDYPPAVEDETKTGTPGEDTVFDPLANLDAGDLTNKSIDLVDPETGDLVKEVVTDNGKWVVGDDGKITFEPNEGYDGAPDEIDYVVTDDQGNQSAPGTLKVDYPPEPEDDIGKGKVGEDVSINVLENDEGDAKDPTSVEIVDADGNVIGDKDTPYVVPGEGKWVVGSDGSIKFEPEDGFEGDPTPIQYTVADTTGNRSEPASVSIEYAPVATDDTVTGESGKPVSIDPLANDSDPDNNLDPSSVAIVGADPETGELETDEGTWSVDPDSGVITFTPKDGFTGDPAPIEYTVKDTAGNESEPASVTVDYPQNPPVTTDDEVTDAVIGETQTIDVLGNDSDPENDIDPSTLEIVGAGDDGKKVVPGEGVWEVVDGKIVFTPEDGYTGDPTPIEYTVEDSTGAKSEPASVTIDYAQPPVTQDQTAEGVSGEPTKINVLGDATDPDNDIDPTTVKILDADGNPVTELVVDGEGTWSVDPETGEITFTPEEGFTGDPTPIEFTVEDSQGNVSEPKSIAIDYPQTPPTAKDDVMIADNQSDIVTIDVLGNDSDPENDIDPTSVKIAGSDEDGKLVVPGEGTWTTNPETGAITFTPELDENGQPLLSGDPTPISYTVTDKTGLTATASVTIDYPPFAPVAEDDEKSGTVDLDSGELEDTFIDVFENDYDPDETDENGDTHGETLDRGSLQFIDPETDEAIDGDLVVDGEGTWSVDSDTGIVKFDPLPTFFGDPTPVEYQMDDEAGTDANGDQVGPHTSNRATITIDYPQAPETKDQTAEAESGKPKTINVLDDATDPDGNDDIDKTTLALVGADENGELVVPGEGVWSVDDEGNVTFTPDDGYTGDPTPVQFTVKDKAGLTSEPKSIEIDYPQNAPVLIDDKKSDVPSQTIATVSNVLGSDKDPENDIDPTTFTFLDENGVEMGLEMVVEGEGTWKFNPDTDEVTFEPESDFTGDPTPVDYLVTDKTGITAAEPATITVDYIQTAPKANPDYKAGETGQPVTLNPVADTTTADDNSDSDPEDDIDPTTVRLIDANGTEVTNLKVDGQGTWRVDTSTGDVTFTPEADFKGDPDPVDYSVKDKTGLTSNVTTITVDYPPEIVDDEEAGVSGEPTEVDVLGNDPASDIDPTTVMILDENGEPTTELVVPGEGTWKVDSESGKITFTPETKDGKVFTGDPTPIEYTVKDTQGNESAPAMVTIDYPQSAPEVADDEATGETGLPVTIDVLANDTDAEGDLDPTTVMILDDEGNPVTELTVPGEGVWTVDPETGKITFTPEDSFTGDPTPISYEVSDTTGEKSEPATVTVDYPEISQASELVKSVTGYEDTNGNLVTGDVGDTVLYSFAVTNTGDSAMKDVSITDEKLGLENEPVEPSNLLPGETGVLEDQAYVLTQEDLDSGEVSNTATSTGVPVRTTVVDGEVVADYDVVLVNPETGEPYKAGDVVDNSDSGTEETLDEEGNPIVIDDPAGTGTDSDATVLKLPIIPSNLVLSGTVFLDLNSDGKLDAGDDPSKGGLVTVELLDEDGEVVLTTETDANGDYEFKGFAAGTYTVRYKDENGRTLAVSDPITLDAENPEQRDVDLPIDPSGVIYDVITGEPVAGVLISMTDARGNLLPDACLAPGQQSQTTAADGFYRFDINAGADAACPTGETEYYLSITSVPSDYLDPPSSLHAPSAGPVQVTGCSFDTNPGGNCSVSDSAFAPDPDNLVPYYMGFLLESGDPNVVNNHIPLDPRDIPATNIPDDLIVEKSVISGNGSVVLGETVVYQINVTNNTDYGVTDVSIIDNMPIGLVYTPGTATVDGTAITPELEGRAVIFDGLDVGVGSSITIQLAARVTADAPLGDLTNTAVATDADGNVISNTAEATVSRKAEVVFDCSDVIGKVFDDKNQNGIQDGPDANGVVREPGLPHVRLSTATGTLITTDEHGRFHVPCAELPKDIGTNFILKVDTRTLPTGYRMTTENPRVVRLTAGKLAKINFGASISRVVDVDLTANAFDIQGRPSAELVNAVPGLLNQIKGQPSVLRISYYTNGESKAEANRRLDAVEKVIRDNWRNIGRYKLNIERTIKRLN